MPWRICAKQWCERPNELIGNAITHFVSIYIRENDIWVWHTSIKSRMSTWKHHSMVFLKYKQETHSKHHHRWNFNPIICQFGFTRLIEVWVCLDYFDILWNSPRNEITWLIFRKTKLCKYMKSHQSHIVYLSLSRIK